jgi:hypothetical protein
MTVIVIRLRAVVRSLGNDGAVANAGGQLRRAAEARAAVDRLERRFATLAVAPLPDAARGLASPRFRRGRA